MFVHLDKLRWRTECSCRCKKLFLIWLSIRKNVHKIEEKQLKKVFPSFGVPDWSLHFCVLWYKSVRGGGEWFGLQSSFVHDFEFFFGFIAGNRRLRTVTTYRYKEEKGYQFCVGCCIKIIFSLYFAEEVY
ncbi:hypothetical protein L2E82_29485 [Cichorium intybus]|uniref:Uncharacterized protein n=1 Tax=Cichorium intybus TaxID=13427 RepID=A0ACB9CY31_CICIN|nr:hypothetical protein L2E82_29485 [Cichorium intybus]